MGWKLNKIEKSNGNSTQDFIRIMVFHARRMLKIKGWFHSFTNFFVECCRAHAYHAGHIWMIQTVLTIFLAIAFWYF